MKTKHFFLLIVAVTFVANVFATDIPKMSIIPLRDTKALVSVQHTVPNVSEISIASDRGEIGYYKKSKKEVDMFKKVFDLSQLENGEYRLTLKAGNATVKNDLMIENGMVSVLKQRNEMKPYFAAEKDNIILSYLNFNKEEMTVHVYNGNKLVFSKKLGNDLAMHRILNLEQLKNGNYNIHLIDTHNMYGFSFSK